MQMIENIKRLLNKALFWIEIVSFVFTLCTNFALIGRADSTILAIAIGIPIGLLVAILCLIWQEIIGPSFVAFAKKLEDPQDIHLASLYFVLPSYFALLFVPIGILYYVKPQLPVDCSITISWMVSIACALLFIAINRHMHKTESPADIEREFLSRIISK